MAEHGVPSSVSVAVLGASGYTGGELVRLLIGHPSADLRYLGVRDAAQRSLDQIHPHLAGRVAAPLGELSVEAATDAADVVFLALPNGHAKDLAPELVENGRRVIDISGDFRLPADRYPEWYGFEHPAPAWLEKAVYGLPEWFADTIRDAELIANPGCYTTTAILGLAPLLKEGLIEGDVIQVDGKSGLSGAGRGASEATSYVVSSDSVRPYRFPGHQHTPEFEHVLNAVTGASPRVIFVPHLVPSVRGVLCTSYARATGDGVTTESLTEVLVAAYADAPFVRVLPAGEMADTKRSVGSNLIELHAAMDPRTGTVIVVGALDNLIKGAAGQAIQNFNLMHGLAETAGLSSVGVYP
ncbi:MAG: N-acetyl-gamma-glutamyl-phosphate reductase [Actinomycetota bacterium]